jgi:chorismate mutase
MSDRPVVPNTTAADAGTLARIDELRRRIDELDVQLVALLNARASCALDIGRIKRDLGMEIYQPDRETQVLAQVRAASGGPLPPDAITRVFERIIDEARRLERTGAPEESQT